MSKRKTFLEKAHKKDKERFRKNNGLPVLGRDSIPYEYMLDSTNRIIEGIREEFNKDFVFGAMLANFAGIIGGAYRIRPRSTWEDISTVWLAIVGHSGTAKTHAMKRGLKPINSIDARYVAQNIEAYENYEQDLREYNKHKKSKSFQGDEPKKPVERHILLKDFTMEAAQETLSLNPMGLLVSVDELANFTGSMNKYRKGQGGDEKHWLSMYSGDSIKISRKEKQTLYVPEKSTVSVVGGIQPDILSEFSKGQSIKDGFLARFSFIYPENVWGFDGESGASEFNEEAYKWYVERSVQFCELCRGKNFGDFTGLTFDQEAQEIWENWRRQNQYYTAQANKKRETALASIYSKLGGLSARFTLILHLLEHVLGDTTISDIAIPTKITARTAKLGIQMVEYFRTTSKRAFEIAERGQIREGNEEIILAIASKMYNPERWIDGKEPTYNEICEYVNELIRREIIPTWDSGRRGIKDRITRDNISRWMKDTKYKSIFDDVKAAYYKPINKSI